MLALLSVLTIVATLLSASWLPRIGRRVRTSSARRIRQMYIARRRKVGARARARLVRAAARDGEAVLLAYVGLQPATLIFEGACSGREVYFNGDRSMYKTLMTQRRTPARRSLPGQPPRIGTRRRSPC